MLKVRFYLILIALITSQNSFAATMQQEIITSIASIQACRNTSSNVGGDTELFNDLNFDLIKVAEKLGYTDNFNNFYSIILELEKN